MVGDEQGPERGCLTPLDGVAASTPETIAPWRLAEGALGYLDSMRWFPGPEDIRIGLAIPGVVIVLLVKLRQPVGDEHDEWLWVMGGDLPAAHLVVDRAPDARQAILVYCEVMEEWVRAVRSGVGLDDVFPVPVKPTTAHARRLESRLQFLRTRVLPSEFSDEWTRTGTVRGERTADGDGLPRAGHLVVDHTGNEGILYRRCALPPEEWLSIQRDERMRQHRSTNWWKLFPIAGGSACVPEPILTVVGQPGADKIDAALKSANEHAVRKIQALFPETRRSI